MDILQRFLQLQLFTVQGDDARLEKIRAATAELEAAVLADPTQFLRGFLAATDPHAPAETPALKTAAAALEAQWNSYSNIFSSPPVALFRAMLAQATLGAAEKNAGYATCTALLLRNIVQRRDFGSEGALWRELLDGLDAKYERAAADAWADNFRGPPAAMPKKPAEKPAKVDRGKLQMSLLGAAGPNGPEAKAGTDPNPNWPAQNELWAGNFASRSAVAIGEAVDETVAAALQGRSAVDKVVFETLEQRLPNAEAVQRRTRLLWWKEAGYSPVIDRGYIEMSVPVVAIVAAVDVHRMVPTLSPRSVEFFLRAAVASRAGTTARAPTEWLGKLADAADRGAAASALPALVEPTDLLAQALNRAAANTSTTVSGLYAGDGTLTLGDLSVVVFRELQALAAISPSAA